ncbi:uncharacterized protein F54H12.2-like [Nasonia vitripennis]|uniref:Uncharacterized protein n=1 Tax=Nasonia vitripennis TaxID=7425 RepID=A0A7M7IX03_NASVI|nr:uncharacterized protein F54H12.2-like [Nasonia vitripennis]
MSHYIRYYDEQVGGGGVRHVYSGSTAVDKEAVRTGINLLDDVANNGSNFKEAFRYRTKESGKKLKRKAGSEHYFDLAHTILHVQAKIVPADEATATTEDLKLGPINNFMHSMFNQIDVFFNQKIVSPPNNAYPYRAYIETLLNYAPADKESHLTASMLYDDTSGGFDSPANAVSTATAPMIDKMLINGVEMYVRLVRSKDAFCLMDATADGKFKVSIKEATLIVRRVKISPGILLAHARYQKPRIISHNESRS